MELLKVQKTSLSKIAINHYLLAKETASTIEEYRALFYQLATILFEIDSCTKDELLQKFNEGSLNPIGTEEHQILLGEDLSLFINKMLWMENEFNLDECKYTNSDLIDNLDKFKFL
ncbi:hypothetical protein [Flavobacterium sp.]|uniref:hypothetical protein n=1 Tax=Flavobacterium sp. TaxID=239 RepID=UPI0037C052FC